MTIKQPETFLKRLAAAGLKELDTEAGGIHDREMEERTRKPIKLDNRN